MSFGEDDGACLWAHSPNKANNLHDLVDHLTEVGRLASEFASAFDAQTLAWWLGLLHDVGKAAEEWQRRLLAVGSSGDPIRIDHKAAGTRLAVQSLGLWRFAMAVHGHHGGLASPPELHSFLTSPDRDRGAETVAVSRLAERIPELRQPVPPAWPGWAHRDPLAGEMLLRMLFSALVDADYLDTAAHFDGTGRPWANPVLGMAELAERFERGRARALAERELFSVKREPSSVDELRGQVYEACMKAVELPRGFFVLDAPTGAGKTFAAGGFAIHHAAHHGLRRVVVAVPFLSVTDQNAKIYRDLLDPGETGQVVLEHHSAVDLENTSQRSKGRNSLHGDRWQRLTADNWDAEFIVTTTVQLFESLHARHPTRMRKLHRLARSVIVLDEVQALPVHVLEPALLALRQLVDHFGVTVLVSSATQPAFWGLPVLAGVEPRKIVADRQDLYTALRRVRFRWWVDPKPTLDEVAAEASTHRRALVVVNTTAHARHIYKMWQAMRHAGDIARPTEIRHLSTRMCGRHRLNTIEEIGALLQGKAPVRVVSTQLIEAGVDLDFPVLYRALAPAEALLQAAGRCNREGHLGRQGGLVVLFDPVETGRPSTYELPLHETRRRFGPALVEPDDLRVLDEYFQGLYATLGPEARGQAVVEARREWDCVRVAELFRMINEDSVPVLVDYTSLRDRNLRKKADRAVKELERRQRLRPDLLRHLQPFLASLPRRVAARLPEHQLQPVVGDLRAWKGRYDPHVGIDIDSEDQ